ncbi:GH92 family glycosyl hydrolase [Zhouia sp. PK063]|uniref:GH92 family glycosyl hydrolase n=1 Tax=Zhouia sp. PK063 TaxID=3373602 RepID=UPI0037AE20CE
MRKISIMFLSVFAIVMSSCNSQKNSVESNQALPKDDLTHLVNPFIGTAPLLDTTIIGYTPPKDWRVWAGLVYPGSTLPNAMVQLSPITMFHTGAGYQYEDPFILGFTHTNKGHWNLCNLPILPLSNKLNRFKSTFSHDNETASPGYYQVYLKDFDVNVRLTSTYHGAIHEYTYKNTDDERILFNLSKSNNGVSDWDIKVVGGNKVEGFQKVGGDNVHFYGELNTKIKNLEVEKEDIKKGYAILHLESIKEPVVLKLAISYVSIANAKENFEAELKDKNFKKVHQDAIAIWNKKLQKIKVKGGTDKERTLFYTSFYRALQWPALRSDVNGQFIDEKGNVRKENFKYYTLPSLWDTYRNKLVLLELVSPDVTADVISSLVDRGKLTGFIPTFFHGDHAAAFISGAYNRGIDSFDVKEAYALLLNNAYKEGGTRPYIQEYIDKGYIATPEVAHPHVETKAKAGVAKTLEYAFDDYALSLLAKKMGDSTHYQDLTKRSKNYKNVFDTKSKFMRGKLENGKWVSNFDPQYPYYEYMYREANAWQLSFFAPHDMNGLVQLYGGKAAFEEKLDSLFTTPWNPNHIARNVSGFIGQYSQGNQPDHETPWAYYFVNKPVKSQAIIDKILKDYYGIGKEGLALSGMDDAGEMSAWYVFSAIGLYPYTSADARYIVSLPIFDEVKWTTESGKTIDITKKGNSRDLQTIKVDDNTITGFYVGQDIFTNGANIELDTK